MHESKQPVLDPSVGAPPVLPSPDVLTAPPGLLFAEDTLGATPQAKAKKPPCITNDCGTWDDLFPRELEGPGVAAYRLFISGHRPFVP